MFVSVFVYGGGGGTIKKLMHTFNNIISISFFFIIYSSVDSYRVFRGGLASDALLFRVLLAIVFSYGLR